MTNQPRHPFHPSTTLTSTPTSRIFISQPPPSVPPHLLLIPPSTLTTKKSHQPPITTPAPSSFLAPTRVLGLLSGIPLTLSQISRTSRTRGKKTPLPPSPKLTHPAISLLRPFFNFFAPVLPPSRAEFLFHSLFFFYSPCTHTPIPRPSSLPIPSFPSPLLPAKVS